MSHGIGLSTRGGVKEVAVECAPRALRADYTAIVALCSASRRELKHEVHAHGGNVASPTIPPVNVAVLRRTILGDDENPPAVGSHATDPLRSKDAPSWYSFAGGPRQTHQQNVKIKSGFPLVFTRFQVSGN